MIKTLPEVESAIAQYEGHIKSLSRITQEGSPQGREMAKAKLAKVRNDLDLLLKQRTRLVKTGLGYYHRLGQNDDKKKAIPALAIIGLLAIVGLFLTS